MALDGIDGLDLLQRISTNDVSKLEIGEHVETVLTNEKGRIVDLLIVHRKSPTSLIISGLSNQSEKLADVIGKFIVMEDTTLKLLSGDWIQYLTFNLQDYGVIADIAEPNMIALRLEHSSAKQVLFIAEKLSSRHLDSAFTQRGIKVCTKEQYEDYRIVNGIPGHPNEISLQFNPLEVGLESQISFTKGCYVGQEVIARLDTYQKTQKRIRRFLLSKMPYRLPTTLFTQEREEVGILTSCTSSSIQNGRILGLGFVAPNQDGRELSYLLQQDGVYGLAKVIPN